MHSWYAKSPYGDVYAIGFSLPAYDVKYAGEQGDKDREVLSIDVVRMTVQYEMVNSEFDPETRTIHEFNLWHGLSVTSSAGKWIFDRGGTVLKYYEVAGSFDGEIHPAVIYEAGEPQRIYTHCLSILKR